MTVIGVGAEMVSERYLLGVEKADLSILTVSERHTKRLKANATDFDLPIGGDSESIAR